jgi:hypothetical protein
MGLSLRFLLLAAWLIGAAPSHALDFATPLKLDSVELVGVGIIENGALGDNYCGNHAAPGDGFFYLVDTDINDVYSGADYCPGEERFRMISLGGPFHGYTVASSTARATFADVAPAEGEAMGVSFISFADEIFTPLDFVRFEVRNVGGQLHYGAVSEVGETGFTGTLDFTETLVLELTTPYGGAPTFRYSVDGGAFVDVSAELAGTDPVTTTFPYLGIEASIVPEPPLAVLLLAALAALRRARP